MPLHSPVCVLLCTYNMLTTSTNLNRSHPSLFLKLLTRSHAFPKKARLRTMLKGGIKLWSAFLLLAVMTHFLVTDADDVKTHFMPNNEFLSSKLEEHEMRKLAPGDLDGLNNLVRNLFIVIPDINIDETGVKATISKLTCGGLQLNQLSASSSRQDNVVSKATVVAGVSLIKCSATVTYSALIIFSGTLPITVSVTDSGISANDITFQAPPDYRKAVPTSVALGSCQLNIHIDQINFGGDSISSKLLNTLLPVIKDALTKYLGTFACDQIKTLVGTKLSDMLKQFAPMVQPYLTPPIPPTPTKDAEIFIVKKAGGKQLVQLSSGQMIQVVSTLANQLLGTPVDPTKSARLLVGDTIASMQDKDGWISFPIDQTMYNKDILTQSNVTFKSVSLKGLDSLSDFTIIKPEPNSNFTLSHKLRWQKIYAKVPMHLSLDGGFWTNSLGRVAEDIVVTLDITGLAVQLTAAMGMDATQLMGTSLQEIAAQPLPCLQAALKAVQVTNLITSIEDIGGPSVDGFICKGLDSFINDARGVAMTVVEGVVLTALPNLMQGFARTTLNTMAETALSKNSICPPMKRVVPPVFTDKDYVDFHNPNITFVLNAVGAMLNSGNGATLNKAIGLVLTQFGLDYHKISINHGAALLDLDLDTKIGHVKAKISDLSISNLDIFSKVNVLTYAPDKYATRHAMTIGDPKPLTVSLNISFNVAGELQDDIQLSIGVGQINMAMDLMLQIGTYMIMPLKITHLTNPACLASALTEYGIENGKMDINNIAANVICNKCSGRKMAQLGPAMASKAGKAQLLQLIKMGQDFASKLGVPVKDTLDHVISSLAGTCPGHQRLTLVNNYEVEALANGGYSASENTAVPFKDNTHWTPDGFSIVICLLVIYCVSVLGYMWVRFYRKKKLDKIIAAQKEKGETPAEEEQLVSLFGDKTLPSCYKFLLPAMFASGIVIFLTAHSFVGATVDLTLTVGDEVLQADDLFTFSLSNSIHDMLGAGAWPLAALIAVFSGAWPYIKILSMAFCYYMPGYVVDPQWRGRILFFLDVMGKWSILDVFVLVMMMAAFRMHIAPPSNTGFLPNQFLIADVVVNPHWGIFGFVIAATFSICANFMIVRLHRDSASLGKTKLAGALSPKSDDGNDAVIVTASGVKKSKSASKKVSIANFVLTDSLGYVSYTKWGKLVVTALLLISLGLFTVGTFVQSFRFTFQGLVTLALNWSSTSIKSYSLWSIAAELSGQAGTTFASQAGIFFLQFSFLVVAFVIPVARILVMLVLWVVPLDVKTQHNLQEASEFFHSWSCLEVFLVSVVAAMFEVNQMAIFMLEGGCDQIDAIMVQYMAGAGAIPPEQATCFSVKTELLGGIWLLVIGSMVGTVVGRIVTDTTERVIAERHHMALEIDDECSSSSRNFSFSILKWTYIVKVEKTRSDATATQKQRRRTYAADMSNKRKRTGSVAMALDDPVLAELAREGAKMKKKLPAARAAQHSGENVYVEQVNPLSFTVTTGGSEHSGEVKIKIPAAKTPPSPPAAKK